MGASERLAEKLEPIAAGLAAPGEEIHGTAIATKTAMFSGSQVALVLVGERLVIQPLDRKLTPKGEPLALTVGDVESYRISGLGDGWLTAISVAANKGIELRLKVTSGEKFKLMMMDGGGGMIGSLGGGEVQERGVLALAEWLRRVHAAGVGTG
jgi:hypothetical protein